MKSSYEKPMVIVNTEQMESVYLASGISLGSGSDTTPETATYTGLEAKVTKRPANEYDCYEVTVTGKRNDKADHKITVKFNTTITNSWDGYSRSANTMYFTHSQYDTDELNVIMKPLAAGEIEVLGVVFE